MEPCRAGGALPLQLANNFLLAMPGLVGDYFASTLTYICEHNEEGALGIIVNRATDLSVLELVSQLGLATVALSL